MCFQGTPCAHANFEHFCHSTDQFTLHGVSMRERERERESAPRGQGGETPHLHAHLYLAHFQVLSFVLRCNGRERKAHRERSKTAHASANRQEWEGGKKLTFEKCLHRSCCKAPLRIQHNMLCIIHSLKTNCRSQFSLCHISFKAPLLFCCSFTNSAKRRWRGIACVPQVSNFAALFVFALRKGHGIQILSLSNRAFQNRPKAHHIYALVLFFFRALLARASAP